MSEAVTSTGILIKRSDLIPPSAIIISAISAADPTEITTYTPHGLATGDEVTIAGTNSTPVINGDWVVTVTGASKFTIDELVTAPGTQGSSTHIWQTVGELTEVTPGGKSRNKIETSTHNDGSESHVLGILRQADPGMKINYVGSDATHKQLHTDIDNNLKANWRFIYPSGVSRTGAGYVQKFDFDNAPVDGKQGATIAITWAGHVTDDAGDEA